MKTKTMLMASLLVIVASFMSMNVMAQSSDVLLYKTTGDTIKVGDVVKISKDYEHYETKEHIIHWAFDSTHVIRQVNSKFHPNAVLLKRIYSWIPADAAVFVSRAEEQKPKVVKEKTVKYDTIIRIDTLIHRIDTLRRIDTICGPGKTPIRIDTVYIHDTIWEYKYDTVFVPVPVPGTGTGSPCDSIKPWGVRNRFSIGLRGGFASTMAQPATAMPLGYQARLDLQYAHYWPVQKKCYVGIMTGVSAGYMNTDRHMGWYENYTVKTDDGFGGTADVEYEISADDIHENLQQIQVEVPLMFSLLTTDGLFFNIGPRFMLPVYTPYKQVIANGNIKATDLNTNVEMLNNPIYGMLSGDQITMKGQSKRQFSLTVALGLELGYEFKLPSNHSISLGAYANYGVYDLNYGLFGLPSSKGLSPVIAVTPPSGSTLAHVDVYPLQDVQTNAYGHLDAGIKVSYNFDFK